MSSEKEQKTALNLQSGEKAEVEAFRPSLQVRRTNQTRSLVASLLAALGLMAALCAILAVISVTIESLAKEELYHLKVASISTETPLEEAQADRPIFSLAKPQPPTKPASLTYRIPDAPELNLTPLEPESPSDFALDWEELEFDSPFKEKTVPVKEKKPAPQQVVEKPKAKKPVRPRRDPAALARKIVQKAVVTSRAAPTYPGSARRKKQEGQVVVTVTVGPSGKVSSSYVSRSSKVAALDSAALSAARRFRFSPAKNGLGQSVSTQKAIPFTFKLSN